MRLGLDLSHPTTVQMLERNLDLAVAAEGLGYDICWVAEAYGADTVSILGALTTRTETLGIGAGVMQIPGRTPALTAMTAATLDALSHGRFHLGLGVSGPQVSEGWHGVPFADPLGRTREYVAIVRDGIARKRVAADGRHFTLPLTGGQGKSLVLSLQSVRTQIPIYLAAVGPKNLELAAEIADGWLGIFVDASSPEQVQRVQAALDAAGRDRACFDINVGMAASVDDNLERAADRVRPYAALYIGGMGSKETNFYHRIAAALGYQKEADQVQERFMARDYAGAGAAVPTEFLDRVALLGDEARIGAKLRALSDAGVTTVSVHPFTDAPAGQHDTLATVVAAARTAGVHV